MKKLLLGLIATVILSFSGQAQTMSETAKQSAINAQVVMIVNVSKTFYSKGQSYDDFVRALLIPSPTVPSQDIFLKKVFFHVSNNTPDCDIMKESNSEFKNFVTDLSKSPRNQGNPETMGKKKWWQILVNLGINIAVDILFPGNTQDDIDLWP